VGVLQWFIKDEGFKIKEISICHFSAHGWLGRDNIISSQPPRFGHLSPFPYPFFFFFFFPIFSPLTRMSLPCSSNSTPLPSFSLFFFSLRLPDFQQFLPLPFFLLFGSPLFFLSFLFPFTPHAVSGDLCESLSCVSLPREGFYCRNFGRSKCLEFKGKISLPSCLWFHFYPICFL
jgi:hypothetical protein